MSKYTEKTLKHLRDNNYVCWKVEYWNSFARKRVDAFGFGDILCTNNNKKEISLIQTFSSAFAEHKRKILEDEKLSTYAKNWLTCNGAIYFIGWRKLRIKGKPKATEWKPRIEELKLIKDELIFNRSEI